MKTDNTNEALKERIKELEHHTRELLELLAFHGYKNSTEIYKAKNALNPKT